MDALKRMGITVIPVMLAIAPVLNGCSPQGIGATRVENPLRPIASIQELMQSVVDTSADGVWNAVETVSTRAGDEVREPRSPEQWQDVRRAAITLIEGSNLLLMPGRTVGRQYFPAEADGALDSAQIEAKITANRTAFVGFAVALRAAGVDSLAAVDAKDPAALVHSGGAIDAICEGCHLTFWYPNQVIPPFPQEHDASHPILRLGAPEK